METNISATEKAVRCIIYLNQSKSIFVDSFFSGKKIILKQLINVVKRHLRAGLFFLIII